MKKILLAGAAMLLLSGCAYGPRDHDRYAGGGVAVGVDYYDGYYDGFYGPYNDGYWGNDGFYYYSDNNRAWHRDDSHHFRHDNGGNGWNHVHGTGAHRDH